MTGPRRASARVGHADTNLFVALLAGPSHTSHDQALSLFRRVAEGHLTLVVTPVIVAELVYVSKGALKWSRTETAARLTMLLDADGLIVREGPVIRAALELYGQFPRLEFADAYIGAAALGVGPGIVVSFDADFDSIEGVARIAA